MRHRFLTLALGAGLLAVISGCSMVSDDAPHVIMNPVHLWNHAAKIVNPTDGEIHNLHISIDRVLFGIPNYKEEADFPETEAIYTRH